MSSDGASEKPRSARPGRSDDTGGVQIAMAILLVLAVVATVVMVFSDNPMWMRIGTLAALWAAFIGAFLVGRYKRQAASEAARVRDLATVYELQLEREISARREHELVVEKDLRDKVQAETSDSVTALRQEIAALREQLAQLTGQPLPEDRFAVGHDAPAAALTAGASQTPRTSVPSERVEPRRAASASSSTSASTPMSSRGVGARGGETSGPRGTAAGVGAAAAGAAAVAGAGAAFGGVGRDSTPSTESTGRIRPVTGETRDDSAARPSGRGPAVRPSEPSGREHVFTSDRGETPTSGSGSTAAGWGAESRRAASAQDVRPQPTGSRETPAQRPAESQQPTAQTTPIAREGGHTRPQTVQPLAGAVPTGGDAGPSTPRPRPVEEQARPAGGRHGRPEQETPAAQEQQPAARQEPAAHRPVEQPEAQQQAAPEKSAEQQAAEQQAAEEHAARHSKGSSVAELMARLGAEASATGGGRRRRRAED